MTKIRTPDWDSLPDDFDPMDLAAFLDGEDNGDVSAELEASSALRSVATVAMSAQPVLADAASIDRLVERAEPLAKRVGSVAQPSIFDRVMGWLGADIRATAAAFAVAMVAFGAGLTGGIGLGGTGLDAEDVLVSASVADVFAFDTSSTADLGTLIETDAFDSVFGSIQ